MLSSRVSLDFSLDLDFADEVQVSRLYRQLDRIM